jgi:hypothetical protein
MWSVGSDSFQDGSIRTSTQEADWNSLILGSTSPALGFVDSSGMVEVDNLEDLWASHRFLCGFERQSLWKRDTPSPLKFIDKL